MDNNLNVTEVKIPVPWGHISGKWWGSEEKQPIIVVHGWQDNAGSFDLLIPLLPKTHSYLCIDLPGHGLSSHLPQGTPYYLASEGVLCIRRVLKHYGWNTVSLLGHSLGAVICFIYAATYPAETNMVIAIDSIQPALTAEEIVLGSGSAVDKFLEYDSLPKEFLPQYDYNEAVNMMKQQYKISKEGCDVLLKRGLEKTPSGKYIFSRDVRLQDHKFSVLSEETMLSYARRIKCKYLSIRHTDNSDMYEEKSFRKIFDAMRQSSINVSLSHLPGTNYDHLEHPEEVAAVIDKFLCT